ncbi:Xaa-Pro peptidase family protein [Streptomyces sp. NEAU-YJ-81]|uniref:M24 family metallopeptidase n=1 Tax=Streptomyces sp. NEAU-YJ-81 TaxID=2820288 RepID=UPI001ABC941A|nr:Xaa-Pro peptidase family protein [Streptomyces sp. NEAU-YJ-81]MBO3678549.1 aminopeptidase P family protein [Streptomyces sp. NEAU-YJ-81]
MIPDTDTVRARWARVQHNLRADGVDAMVVVKPQNTFYLSGYTPMIYSHPVLVVLPAEGEPVFILHALRAHSSRTVSRISDIRPYGRWAKEIGPDHWWQVLAEVMAERGLSDARIGIEGEFLPANYQRRLELTLPEAAFTDTGQALMRARYVKDAAELESLRVACEIADAGMDAALEAVAGRRSEVEVSSVAMRTMQEVWSSLHPDRLAMDFGNLEGGVFNALWAYSLVGDRVPMNSAPPTSRRPVSGEIQWTVIWTAIDGMHAENERSVAVGPLPAERQRAFEALLAIREEVQPYLRPGLTCAEVYEAARTSYVRHGYGDYLPGRIGHGLGLGPHEQPSLGPHDDLVLEPGMTLTFEPNLRIPSFGGLQHSDSLVITEAGHELLTHTRRDLIQV